MAPQDSPSLPSPFVAQAEPPRQFTTAATEGGGDIDVTEGEFRRRHPNKAPTEQIELSTTVEDKVALGLDDADVDDTDPEAIKNRRNQDIRLPLLFFCLSFIFPPLGWIGFMRARDSPRDTPRGAWAFRSCALGSFLAFVYTFTAACVVGHLGQLSDSEATDWGCGFGGKCPLFKDA
eukprot:Gregarina_sp_Poly_1__5339@NODE_2820_length_1680_cov_196_265344_g1778_i0_p2_GENE_NODE_2820_length_1680_cov_196_265344_g1778_i0NODE_2820_length_1680_cov_196_265344_g1778_i0_p2_ORF_typecomplete_len177_score24_82_NODE_2820_length_1680_cov_196_265344_g1778_i011071637